MQQRTTFTLLNGNANATAFPLDCENEGICNLNVTQGVAICSSPPRYTGDVCETMNEETDTGNKDGEICDLICLNGGWCRNSTIEFPVPDGISQNVYDTWSLYGEAFEGCVCPHGYTGQHCEHSYEACGAGEHLCVHGSRCVPPKMRTTLGHVNATKVLEKAAIISTRSNVSHQKLTTVSIADLRV